MQRVLGLLLFALLLTLLAREFVHRRSTFYEAGTLRPPYAVLHPAYYGKLALWIDPLGCVDAPGCTTRIGRTAAALNHETARLLAYEAGLWHYFRYIGTSHPPDSCLPDSLRSQRARRAQPDLVIVLDLIPQARRGWPFLRRLAGYLGLGPLRRGYRITYLTEGPGSRRSRYLARAIDSTLQLAGFVGYPGGHLRGRSARDEPRLAPYRDFPSATLLLEIAPCDADYEKVLRAKWIRRWMMQTVLAGVTVYLSRAHAWGVEPVVSWPEAAVAATSGKAPASATRVPPP